MEKNLAANFVQGVVLLMVVMPFIASWLYRRKKTKTNLRPMSLEWTQSVDLLKRFRHINNVSLPPFVLARFQALGVKFVYAVSGAYYGFVDGQYYDGLVPFRMHRLFRLEGDNKLREIIIPQTHRIDSGRSVGLYFGSRIRRR